MDSRRRVTLSGVVVASAAARPGKVDTALKMDWWQVAAVASYPASVLVESTPDWWVPIPGRHPGWDLRS